MKRLLYLFAFLFLVSCRVAKDERNFQYVNLSRFIVLDSIEAIWDFYDKYPVAVEISDSFMYVIQVKAEDCMLVLNMNTKQIIDTLGHVGHGPNDLINPNFIQSVDCSDILIEDGNLRKIMRIDRKSDSIGIVEYIEYPDSIFLASEINLSSHFIVGRKISAFTDKMFFIYNRESDSIFEFDCFPELDGPISDKNYAFAPAIAFNEYRNRVVVGMYFFDMFHVYDMTGKRIKTYCFSENPIPKIDSNTKALDLIDGYSGIIRTFSTEDYCYLLRMSQKDANAPAEYMIIQLNWEGQLVNSYLFNDAISGQFYVDEKMKKIYAIRRYINLDGEEVFGVVAYKF